MLSWGGRDSGVIFFRSEQHCIQQCSDYNSIEKLYIVNVLPCFFNKAFLKLHQVHFHQYTWHTAPCLQDETKPR